MFETSIPMASKAWMISTAPRLAEMYTPPISNICMRGTMVLAVTAKELAELIRT